MTGAAGCACARHSSTFERHNVDAAGASAGRTSGGHLNPGGGSATEPACRGMSPRSGALLMSISDTFQSSRVGHWLSIAHPEFLLEPGRRFFGRLLHRKRQGSSQQRPASASASASVSVSASASTSAALATAATATATATAAARAAATTSTTSSATETPPPVPPRSKELLLQQQQRQVQRLQQCQGQFTGDMLNQSTYVAVAGETLTPERPPRPKRAARKAGADGHASPTPSDKGRLPPPDRGMNAAIHRLIDRARKLIGTRSSPRH